MWILIKTFDRIKNFMNEIKYKFWWFYENHKNKKKSNYNTKKCFDYSKVENLFRFLSIEENSFIFELLRREKRKIYYIGLNPDKIWDINKII